MNPLRSEQFFLSVREALALTQRPLVSSGAALISGQALETFVQQSNDWLTADVVKAYDPSDYEGIPQLLQQQLGKSVDAFRLLASGVSAPGMASYEQSKRGLQALEALAASVKDVVLYDWGEASRRLVEEVKGFCAKAGWPCQWKTRTVEETLLGHYQLPQLTFQSNCPFLVEPLGRFVLGTRGAYDLTVASSGYMASFFRDADDVWQIHVDVGQGVSKGGVVKFGNASFLAIVKDLETISDD